ncbi:MAG: ABC transporter permease [Armatimonadota bacterium]|nr:ABC transporter permease [Armatimonadota bacterium]MDR7532271.1 ABC transporter permease [Armatimonadota bacterium]MDR7537256.1 ABC transporter permease [Armatimonadota bacterium]
MTAARVLIVHELGDALRSRWLLAYAVLFAVLALGLSLVGLQGVGAVGLEGYGRTTASLINLCLLLVPLVALLLGSSGVAADRESGVLELLLAQPVGRSELLLSRFAGALAAVAAATMLGFGIAGVLIGLATGTAGGLRYLAFVGIALVLAGAYLAVGLAISVVARSRTRATAAALAVWFASVVVFDLLLIGAGAFALAGVRGLAAALLLNPVEIARLLALLVLDPTLEVLGPVGGFLVARFGAAGVTGLLLGALAVWTLGPLAVAAALFEGGDVP